MMLTVIVRILIIINDDGNDNGDEGEEDEDEDVWWLDIPPKLEEYIFRCLIGSFLVSPFCEPMCSFDLPDSPSIN